MKKPLVIGGTGFIGFSIVKNLIDKGYQVRATRRESSNTIFLRKLKPELVHADADDPESLKAAMLGCDTVFMAAAHYPRYSVNLNKQVDYAVNSIKNVLNAARETGIQRFIYTGSVTTLLYRKDGIPVKEDDGISKPSGRSVYFSVKYAMEREVEQALTNGLGGTILCVAGCLGPGDVKMGTGFFLVQMCNRALNSYINGKINIVDINDVAEAHTSAALKGDLKRRYIVGNHNLTVEKLLKEISERYEVPMPERKVPLWIGYPLTVLREYTGFFNRKRVSIPLEFIDMLRFGQEFDCGLVNRDICRIDTPLGKTLDDAYEWFRKYKYIKT